MFSDKELQKHERQIREAAIDCGFSLVIANCLHIVETPDKIHILNAPDVAETLQLMGWLDSGLRDAGYNPNYVTPRDSGSHSLTAVAEETKP